MGKDGRRVGRNTTHCATCGGKLGAWKIFRSFTRGSARCFEDHPSVPEFYRTKREATEAKKARGL